VRPLLLRGAKFLGREAMRTDGNIMSEIAANPEQTRDILSPQNIKKLRGGGRKRQKASSDSHNAKRVKIAKRKSSKGKAPPKTIKRDILMIRISHYPIMSGEVEFVSSEFDIFAPKPVQSAILGTDVVHFKPIATVDQNDLKFFTPAITRHTSIKTLNSMLEAR